MNRTRGAKRRTINHTTSCDKPIKRWCVWEYILFAHLFLHSKRHEFDECIIDGLWVKGGELGQSCFVTEESGKDYHDR